MTLAETAPKPAYELRRPRVGLYQPWTTNYDEGWTEWLLDRYRVPYTLLHNEDFGKGDLRAAVRQRDPGLAIGHIDYERLAQRRTVVPSGRRAGRTHGAKARVHRRHRSRRRRGIAEVRARGRHADRIGHGRRLPREFFPLPLLNVGGAPFSCPGSLVRLTVDPSQPLAFGMPKDAIAFMSGGEAFDMNLAPGYNQGDREVRVAARFAAKDLLASGYISGEKDVLGKAALVDARFGAGMWCCSRSARSSGASRLGRLSSC